MGALPTSDMPGYQPLHTRVCSALDRCAESQAVDFKQSAPWDNLKWHLIKTLMAMGNLRDGGIVIIGASEDDDKWILSGISNADLETYDADTITDQVAKYSSPPVGMDIVKVNYQNNLFLAIQAHEFEDTPYICKKNGPDKVALAPGDILVRPLGKPQTKKATTEQEFRELLELAAEKRARRFIQAAHRIGLMTSATAAEQFNTELEGL